MGVLIKYLIRKDRIHEAFKGGNSMKITVLGKNIAVTDGLKNSVEEKLSRLEKFFSGDVDVKVVLSTVKNLQKIEVSIPITGGFIRAEDATIDLYNAIDLVVEKLGKQLRKHKTKLQNREMKTIRFENISLYEEPSDDRYKPIKRKKFGFKPMNEEEAILQMELVGHNFYVFTNSDTEETNVVYKRKDGTYGILEPEEY